MQVRYLVEESFRIPGRGPVLTGLLTDGEIRNGDVLEIEGTPTTVQIFFVDFHRKETPEGPVVGLELRPRDTGRVTAGMVLVGPPGSAVQASTVT